QCLPPLPPPHARHPTRPPAQKSPTPHPTPDATPPPPPPPPPTPHEPARLPAPPASAAMGAQQSVNAGKAKVDLQVDLTHMLCEALLLPPLSSSSATISQIVGRISLKHPSLFGRSEKLDVILDKGVNDSNVVVAFRRPRPEWLSQQSFVIQGAEG
uniref:Uncharacterized protein n=1 Tax=Triticum urartu TaxID=4572 RepID=A0A8R7K2P4_TRIUA